MDVILDIPTLNGVCGVLTFRLSDSVPPFDS